MIEPLVTRASVAYDNATADQRAAGAEWYPVARRAAAALSRDFGITPERAAAVIAALSPTQSWKGNLTVARRLLADPHGRRLLPAHEQARPVATGTRRALALSGQKVEAFRIAIASAGRHGRAVVDRWMVRALLRDAATVNKRDYDACAAALARAAELHGVPVHAMQATVWITTRGAVD